MKKREPYFVENANASLCWKRTSRLCHKLKLILITKKGALHLFSLRKIPN
jgi:hypothetical protein